MKLSVETYVLRETFDDETAIKMIKESGFDAFDYSFYLPSEGKDMLGDDYKEKAVKLKMLADESGIVCNQAHAPFDFSISDEISPENEKYRRIVRSIEAASILGARNIIIHAIKNDLPEDVDFEEYNLRFYSSFIPYCEKYGIHISVENLFNYGENYNWKPVLSDPQEHINFVKKLDSEWFDICIDVGHSAITGYKPECVIGAMDKDLFKALHLHDNDLKNDCHQLPFTGALNWEKIITALKDVGYTGDATFEIFGYLRNFDKAEMLNGLKTAEKVGRKIIGQLEKQDDR